MDDYLIRKHLAEIRGPLLEASGIRALRLYADLLDQLVEKDAPGRDHRTYWMIWRPSVADTPTHPRLEDQVLDALRDDALTLARSHPDLLSELIRFLTERRSIYERIGLYILSHLDPLPEAAIRQEVLSAERWSSGPTSPEFRELVRKSTAFLDESDTSSLLAVLSAGPEHPHEDEGSLDRQWLYTRLGLLRSHLSGGWLARLQDLEREFGPVGSEPAEPTITARWIGPTSPRTQAELLQLRDEDLVGLLLDWVPTGGWDEPTPEGLGREIAAAIKDRPTLVQTLGAHIQKLHPTYVRSVLDGIKEASRSDAAIDWTSALQIAHYASHGDTPVAQLSGDPFEADRDWSAARRSAAWVFIEALERDHVAEEAGPIVAEGILKLLSDPEPDTAYEATYGGSNMDWSTLAINTTRPLATLAAIGFVSSGRHQVETDMILAALDNRLILDHSLAVRSVFGQRFLGLYKNQVEWSAQRIALIFPTAEDAADYWWAAWGAYLTFNRVSPAALTALSDSYAVALQREPPEDWRFAAQPTERLAQHFVGAFANGWVDRSDLLFHLASARGDTRFWREVLSYSGRGLSAESLTEGQTQRLMKLWDLRKEAFLAGRSAAHEIGEFGLWVGAASLPTQWVLENLEWVLTRTALDPRSSWEIMGHLAKYAAAAPAPALRCARLLVDQTAESWRIHSWREDLHKLLDPGTSTGADDRAIRQDLANLLVAKWGFLEFRQYLAGQKLDTDGRQ